MPTEASVLANPLPPTLPTRLLPVLPHAHRHYRQIISTTGRQPLPRGWLNADDNKPKASAPFFLFPESLGTV